MYKRNSNNAKNNIKQDVFQILYDKTYNKVCDLNDDSCGYSNFVNNSYNIHKENPTLAIRLLATVNDAINDKHSFIQDKDTTNRLIVECIKHHDTKLLYKQYLNPIRMPTYSIKAIFDTMDTFSKESRKKLYDKDMYGKVAIFFENAIIWINKIMFNYFVDLDMIEQLDGDVQENLWMSMDFEKLPGYFKIFKHCDLDNKLCGFQIFFNIWHLSKQHNYMTFDVLLRYTIIGLYYERINANYEPYLRLHKNYPKILASNVPNVQIEPSYLEVFRNIKKLNNKLYSFTKKMV